MTLRAHLDPVHDELAPYLVGTLIHEALTLSPEHRIDFTVPEWMEAVVTVAEEHGLKRGMRQLLTGIEL